MRQLLAAALLLTASGAQAGLWCGPDLFHFYTSAGPMNCGADLVPQEELLLEVNLESYDLPGPLAEVRFRVDNWLSPGDPPLGEIAEMWAADAVAGDLTTGITLTWNEGLAPSYWGFDGMQGFHLGTISLLPDAADWVGPNHRVNIRGISYRNMEGDEFFPDGEVYGTFVFNGDGDGLCSNLAGWDPPEWPLCRWTLESPPDGSTVDGNFTFRGELLFIECWTGLWVDAAVELNGVQIGAYHGFQKIDVAQLVDVSGIAEDESFTITVRPDWSPGCPSSYSYTYTLDTTAVGRESFSTIKGRY